MTRIAAWSGPRNLSTAMMRAWENRSDTSVIDEPFYPHYLQATGLDHPLRTEIIAEGPTDLGAAIARCLAPLPDGVEVSYQKHMAQHLLPDDDRDWLDEVVNILLLRDPRRVLNSYIRIREDPTLDDIGLPQQLELAERAVLIIDSDEFLVDPDLHLRSMCAVLDVRFDPAMLQWPPGPRPTDGVWAPAWYGAVEGSTGFGPPPDGPPPSLPPQMAGIEAEAMAIYRELRSHRTVIS